jgi:hypothetical protein
MLEPVVTSLMVLTGTANGAQNNILTDSALILADVRQKNFTPKCFNDWCTGQLVHWSAGVLVSWCTGQLVYWSAGALVSWCTGALVYWSAGVLVSWCTGQLVHWCTGVMVHWCTGALV